MFGLMNWLKLRQEMLRKQPKKPVVQKKPNCKDGKCIVTVPEDKPCQITPQPEKLGPSCGPNGCK